MHPSGIPDITVLREGHTQLRRMAQTGLPAACSAPHPHADLGGSRSTPGVMIISGLARLSAGHYYIRLSALNAQ